MMRKLLNNIVILIGSVMSMESGLGAFNTNYGL